MTTAATKQAGLAGPECHDWPHEAQPLLDLLKEVCEAHAPSGVERELDAIITRCLASHCRTGVAGRRRQHGGVAAGACPRPAAPAHGA